MNGLKRKIKENKLLYKPAHCIKALCYFLYGKTVCAVSVAGFYLEKFGVINKDERFKRTEALKDKYKDQNKRCFIVATGPSVTISDLEKLKNEFTISMNSIVNILDSTSFRPSLYMCQDYTVYERIYGAYDKLPEEKIFIGIGNVCKKIAKTKISLSDVKDLKNAGLFHLDTASSLFQLNFRKNGIIPKFSLDCSKHIIDGGTITYSAIQLAAYMGFAEIVLIGVDCNYSGPTRHIGEYAPEQDFSKTEDKLVDVFNQVFGHSYEELDKRGIKLINATRGGNLKTVPRMNFEKLLKDNKSSI